MSEISEISYHEKIAQDKMKPQGGEARMADARYRWMREGNETHTHLINESTNNQQPFWTEVGKASSNKQQGEDTYGLHLFENNGREPEPFFYIKELLPEKPLTKQEPTAPLVFSHGIRSRKSFRKDWFDSMSDPSREASLVAVYLNKEKLSVTNRGNFRAVLGRDGYAEELSKELPPGESEVTETVLPKGKSQLVMGSPGLWNFLTPAEATKIIADIPNAEEASIALRNEAAKRGSKGDISVIVLNLDVPGTGQEQAKDVSKEKSRTINNTARGPWTQAGESLFTGEEQEETEVKDTIFSILTSYEKRMLQEKELSTLSRAKNPQEALQALFSRELETGEATGTVTASFQDNKLFLANRGNFHAVLSRDGKTQRMTDYAPAEDKAKVTEHTLPQGESQLIMGSAGLWNFMTPEEASKLIAQVKNPEEASTLLRQEAYKRAQLKDGTVGDISVMVVNLNVPEKGVTSLSDRRARKATKPYGRMAA